MVRSAVPSHTPSISRMSRRSRGQVPSLMYLALQTIIELLCRLSARNGIASASGKHSELEIAKKPQQWQHEAKQGHETLQSVHDNLHIVTASLLHAAPEEDAGQALADCLAARDDLTDLCSHLACFGELADCSIEVQNQVQTLGCNCIHVSHAIDYLTFSANPGSLQHLRHWSH